MSFGRWVVLEWALRPWFEDKEGLFGMSHFGGYLKVVFEFCFWMGICSHLRAMLSNPGQTPRLNSPIVTEETKFCRVCNQWKPPRTHHCSMCNVCVHRMDHHCFWINNCVGGANQKYFTLFLAYTFSCTVVALITFSACCVEYLRTPRPKGPTNHFSLLVCTFSAMGIVLFLIYTLEMLKDQLVSIEANQTTIDQYQGKYGEPVTDMQRSLSEGLRDCFGTDWWLWWAPTRPRNTLDYEEPIFSVHDRIELQRVYEEKHRDDDDFPCVLCVGVLVALTVLWPTFRAI